MDSFSELKKVDTVFLEWIFRYVKEGDDRALAGLGITALAFSSAVAPRARKGWPEKRAMS